ncbi:hypothetical protein ACLB2K_025389 [Fragaria x ananassa]
MTFDLRGGNPRELCHDLRSEILDERRAPRAPRRSAPTSDEMVSGMERDEDETVEGRGVMYFIHPILRFLHPTIHASSKRRSSDDELMVIQIEEYHCYDGLSTLNEVFEASNLYLHNKISPSTRLLKTAQVQTETKFSIHFSNKQEFEDVYEGIQMKWKYNSKSKKSNYSSVAGKKQFFELIFDVKHKEMVMDAYLPFVIEKFN